MHKHRSIFARAVFEEGKQLRRIEIQFATRSIHIRSDFNAAHAEIIHRAIEFAARNIGVL